MSDTKTAVGGLRFNTPEGAPTRRSMPLHCLRALKAFRIRSKGLSIAQLLPSPNLKSFAMSADLPLYIMLDTNSLMHFQRPDQIDWLSILGRKGVVLIVTPVLLRELEEQKIKNRSKRLRNRAQALVLWIADYIEREEAVEIRSGVSFAFVRHSPSLDFAAHRLSPTVSDDEFIAHAIEFKKEHGGEVAFFTADTGMRLKLPAHGLKALQPPASLRLPDEPDATERENAKLKVELWRHTNRLPKLALRLFEGGPKQALKSIRLAVDKIEPEPPAQWGMTSEHQYDEYLKDLGKWKTAARSSTAFRIRLENAGSAIATNINVVLTFPDFVLAKRLWSQPEVPNNLALGRFHREMRLPSEDEPTYSDDGTTASFDIANLVHNRTFDSELIWLRFQADNLIKNFSADYEITCVEIVEPIRGSLHFTVEEWIALLKGSDESATE